MPETHSEAALQRRISIIGMGKVGAAIADAVSRRALATHLVLVDVVASRAESEALDLSDAMAILHPLQITHSSDMHATKHSHLIFITAGARQRPNESRLQLLGRNVAILSSFVPQLVQLSPDAIVVVVSNPCDVLTYVTARLAGHSARGRVIGSGTNLDSARLVSALAQRARVAAGEVHAVIIGEHGDSSVAAWSIATIGGLPLRAVSTDLEATAVREQLVRDVRNAAGEIISYKGFTATAVGESCADLARCILSASVNVRPVTTRVAGGTFDGIAQEVYLSLPVRLGAGGVGESLVPLLDDAETALLHKSATVLLEAQREADVHLARVLCGGD
eukprot:TRINITY_DN4152_c0_g1_i1.p3 TRINITY_DN4152_c0_g1~~TRINITY_DN4152_c0_g1_i1.p3  ORF type:complete len:334 (-),score=84.89 TRINITY_DN4152_c0_g1_i1:5031-6032(-)